MRTHCGWLLLAFGPLLATGCATRPPARPAPEATPAPISTQRIPATAPGSLERPSQSPWMAAPAPAASYPPPGSSDTPVINPLNPPSRPRPEPESRSVVLHLASQRFEYLEDNRVIHSGPISSGRAGYETPHGEFTVLSKDKDKESSRYDNQLGMDAWMPWSIQFYGDYFLHEGWLPGYPDSHGCVRVGEKDARFLFDALKRGDPVVVTD